jgi:WD40 repeat protein
MRRSISLSAAALACLALTPLALTPQQESIRTVASLDGEVADGAALSPDGRYLAVGSWDSRGLRAINVADGQSWTLVDGYVERVDWSPQGDLLAFNRWDEEAGNDFIWTLPIDPATGRAAGEARRVSVSGGDVVAFSPDGEFIAFADYNYPGQRVVVLPARGGRERVLAQAEAGINSIVWSDDGEWIYFTHNAFGSTRGVVARVPAAGGAAEVVWETPAGTPWVIEPGPMIVQPEASRSMFFVNQVGGPHTSPGVSQGGDRIRILDRTGQNVLTTLRPPLGVWRGGELWISAATRDATRFYGTKANRDFRLLAVSLGDGGERVLDTSQARQYLAHSESSNRIVFLTDVDGALGFAAISPDGSGRREYRPTARPADNPPHWSWQRFLISPDGNHLAFAAQDTQNHLVVLDLRDGQERVLASGGWLQFRWMSNSELQYDVLEDRVRASRRSIRQVNLNGTDRLLRVISERTIPADNWLTLVNDTVAIAATRERVDLIPLPGGEPRLAFRGHHTGDASVSPDLRYLALKTVSRLTPRYGREECCIEEADAIAIIDLATGQRHDLQLELTSPRGVPAVWHPDGRHLMVNLARSSGERDAYLIPINGDRPRVLARDIGPDFVYPHLVDGGNTLLVTTVSPITTDILELTAGAAAGGSAGGN